MTRRIAPIGCFAELRHGGAAGLWARQQHDHPTWSSYANESLGDSKRETRKRGRLEVAAHWIEWNQCNSQAHGSKATLQALTHGTACDVRHLVGLVIVRDGST